jgi:PST family polysaccharide transporter
MSIFKKLTNSVEKKRLLDNYLSLMTLQAMNFLLPLLTLPYLVRVLGVEKFGLVMFAQSFISFFSIIVDFGFNLSATREISVHRENQKKVTEIFSSIITIKLTLLLVSFIIMLGIVFSFERLSQDWKLYTFTYLMVIGQTIFPVWYFQGMERMRLVTIVNVTSKVLFTLLIFIVIQEKQDYIYVPIVSGIGFISGGVLSLYILYKIFDQKFTFPSMPSLKYYFIDSSQYFLSRVSVSLYTSANAFVLGLLTNNTMVGYYSIAEKLYMAFQYMYQPIIQTLYPYIAKEKNIILFKKIFMIFMIFNISGVIILYFLDSYIFIFLFTKSIGRESLEVFHILLVAIVVVVPSIFLGYPFLGALGFPKHANMSVVYGSISHMTGLALLAMLEQISIYSVAGMVVLTEIVVFVLRVYWTKKENLW